MSWITDLPLVLVHDTLLSFHARFHSNPYKFYNRSYLHWLPFFYGKFEVWNETAIWVRTNKMCVYSMRFAIDPLMQTRYYSERLLNNWIIINRGVIFIAQIKKFISAFFKICGWPNRWFEVAFLGLLHYFESQITIYFAFQSFPLMIYLRDQKH